MTLRLKVTSRAPCVQSSTFQLGGDYTHHDWTLFFFFLFFFLAFFVHSAHTATTTTFSCLRFRSSSMLDTTSWLTLQGSLFCCVRSLVLSQKTTPCWNVERSIEWSKQLPSPGDLWKMYVRPDMVKGSPSTGATAVLGGGCYFPPCLRFPSCFSWAQPVVVIDPVKE